MGQFVRGFLITMTVIFIISSIASFFSWLILRHAHNPVFRVERLAVSGFNVTNPQTFAAVWGANVVVENPNRQFKVYIEQVQYCYVYYMDEFLASSSSSASSEVDPVYLPRKGREAMEVEMKTNNPGKPSVEWWKLAEMGKERNSMGDGVLSFNLRMLVVVRFKAVIGGSKHVSLKATCEGLSIGFVGNETSGVFDPGGKPKPCLVQEV